mmetsp:Transcript_106719/g.299910  ORF Transcript_106719/g.299910 Transcript_106719/m.299910 type:complete len:719 (+) Transcript_106719:64-2220(+)
MADCPDLDLVQLNLGSVLQPLTNISLESMAELIPEGKDTDQIMAEHYQRVSQMCAQIHVDTDKMNPKWNKTYGRGGTFWSGALQDGRRRGGMPYFCPSGWVRFSLNVCPDADFEKTFEDWGYLYHGTKGKFVGAILTSGFRASKGLCFCGRDDHAVYMSPSIEYSGHPRYSRIDYNPETKHWLQVLLQCRVNPKAVWKVCQETMNCEKYGLVVDPDFDNSSMEWLFKPNYIDPATQHRFIKDSVVCTGIMVRVTKKHPIDENYWWSQSPGFLEHWNLTAVKVDPSQSSVRNHEWKEYPNTKMSTYALRGDPTEADLRADVKNTIDLGTTWMSPRPFANGSMRFAYYLHTSKGTYVVKRYNDETTRHIREVLHSTPDKMLTNDVTTYLTATYYADRLNARLTDPSDKPWHSFFVEPCVFHFEEGNFFGEPLVKGKFLKWNNNAGEVNETAEAKQGYMDRVAATYSHFTYCASKGKLMVVDVQGWDVSGHVVFTDPQIHTRSFRSCSEDRLGDMMFQRFSVANFGKTGMLKFFMNHDCNSTCNNLKLFHPIRRRCEEVQEEPYAMGKHGQGPQHGDACDYAGPLCELFNPDLDFIVENATSYSPGQSVMSDAKVVGNFKFRLLIFPAGTRHSKHRMVSAFVKADPAGLGMGWSFPNVKYSITAVNWEDESLSVQKRDTFTFSAERDDQGWHDVLRTEELSCASGWLSKSGALRFRAACSV